MTTSIYSIDHDRVVDATVALGRVNYSYAISKLLPLVNRLDQQRRIQNPRFYERLQRDILRGCLMPPITLAFVKKQAVDLSTKRKILDFVDANIDEGFILDGIQRLSTLKRAYDSTQDKKKFPLKQALFLNIIVCKSVDNLLYRMITLNNGQKPMTARHQIEILAANAFEFEKSGLELATEKSATRRKPGIFNRSDFELGYMAFLSSSVNVDSQKLIQEKLDELLAAKILERDPTDAGIEFVDVLELIAQLIKKPRVDRWFKLSNNLIGFCASIRAGYVQVKKVDGKAFETFLDQFELAFASFDVSKLKLGRARRNAVAYAIKHFGDVKKADSQEITDRLIQVLEQ